MSKKYTQNTQPKTEIEMIKTALTDALERLDKISDALDDQDRSVKAWMNRAGI